MMKMRFAHTEHRMPRVRGPFLRSLRARFLLASVIWTGGLLALAHLLSMAVIRRHTWMMRVDTHMLMLLGVAFALVGFWQVRRGFSPFNELRERLSAVREGSERRVEGSCPSEVQPLVNELNALLDDRERMVAQALSKAGDLAHGLKTPLAVLSQEAERAESASQHEIAATMSQQVERMRRQIDYHLAHARAAVSGATPGARCSVAASVEGLVRTLERLYEHRRLSITADVSPDHSVRGRREDLDEMLGNLLDNACKWASSQVMVSSFMENGSVIVTVDDDGGGLDPAMRDVVLQRGVRADEAAPGSGFGLAIVRDLAELYGGSLVLVSSPAGGSARSIAASQRRDFMISRRHALRLIAAAAVAGGAPRMKAAGEPRRMLARKIPSSGEELPLIGIGTWQTFDVGESPAERAPLEDVLRDFVTAGGRVIDSSPMYGRSEEVVGDLAAKLGIRPKLFLATKVWTTGRLAGIAQMEESMRRLRTTSIDLMQAHNLVDVNTHLATLREWKKAGRIRYIGMTHYTSSAYGDVEALLRREPPDFLQINYSALERDAEVRVLPLAREKGVAVIANRPFAQGALSRRLSSRPLPAWAAEIDCTSWAQLLLKFVVSHPSITCAIPGTSKVAHLRDNIAAAYGRLPDAKLRARIAAAIG